MDYGALLVVDHGGFEIILWGGIKENLKYILPITSREFWFISVYFILCLLAPALNRVVENSTRRQLGILVLVLCGVTYCWATISYVFNFPQIIPDYGGGIVNFVTLYLTARWLRLYGSTKFKTWQLIAMLVGIQVLTQIFQLAYSHLLGFPFTAFENDNSLPCFLSAVTILLLFTRMTFHSRIINLLAVNCLAVYVLHMNDVAWPFIVRAFHLEGLTGWNIVAVCVVVPIIVYMVGIVMEAVRKILMGQVESIVLGKTFKKELR